MLQDFWNWSFDKFVYLIDKISRRHLYITFRIQNYQNEGNIAGLDLGSVDVVGTKINEKDSDIIIKHFDDNFKVLSNSDDEEESKYESSIISMKTDHEWISTGSQMLLLRVKGFHFKGYFFVSPYWNLDDELKKAFGEVIESIGGRIKEIHRESD